MKFQIVPQPRPDSADPRTEFAVGVAWRACTLVTVAFLSMRLAGVTDWQWWAVLLPLIGVAGVLLLAVAAVVAWVIAWLAGGD